VLIALQSMPLAQDSRVVIAYIRACVWAEIEERPFCLLPSDFEQPATLSFSPREGVSNARHHGDRPGLTGGSS
jgi:hypothetical protein